MDSYERSRIKKCKLEFKKYKKIRLDQLAQLQSPHDFDFRTGTVTFALTYWTL